MFTCKTFDVSVSEHAEAIGVSESTLYRMISDHEAELTEHTYKGEGGKRMFDITAQTILIPDDKKDSLHINYNLNRKRLGFEEKRSAYYANQSKEYYDACIEREHKLKDKDKELTEKDNKLRYLTELTEHLASRIALLEDIITGMKARQDRMSEHDEYSR